jgi:membrane-associated protease RseP (regulator of RpoE activity)
VPLPLQLFQGSLIEALGPKPRTLNLAPQDALVPVPSQLFQGSLLLGGAVRAVLGETALNGANVSVHPLLIAGWCGLVSTALNLLPVGAIDGGRILQVRGCRKRLGSQHSG